MAVIDVVKWNATPDVYAWKFPSEQLATWTQLIVAETQDAVMVKEGKMVGPFRSGRHVLDTKNLPFLSKLVNIPFGGKSPFTAEVWFTNKVMTLDVKWGTSDPIQLQDPKYHVMLPVRAFGQYGVRIVHAKKFLLKLVGTLPEFDRERLNSYFKGLILTKVKGAIAKEIIQKKISILEISANLSDMSEALKQSMLPELEEYGLELVNFYVNSINAPETDTAVIRLKDALAKRAEMNIIGYSYEQERSFDTMERAAGNEGTAGGVMGAGMGLGMGFGMGAPMGHAMSGMAGNLNTSGKTNTCKSCKTANHEGAKFCSGCGESLIDEAHGGGKKKQAACNKCSAKLPDGVKFCPSCGDPCNYCQKCGEDNPEGVKVCIACSEQMPAACTKCDVEIPGNSKFCPSCGTSQVKTCANCSSELPPNVKFCPQCGTPAEGKANESE